jgi:hypothetical protein
MNPLSPADRELIADLAAVLGLYDPITTVHLRRKQGVLARANQRLAESVKPAEPTKRHRWHWCKWLLLRGDQ